MSGLLLKVLDVVSMLFDELKTGAKVFTPDKSSYEEESK